MCVSFCVERETLAIGFVYIKSKTTMVKPLEKSIKFWDGHGPLRLVEL